MLYRIDESVTPLYLQTFGSDQKWYPLVPVEPDYEAAQDVRETARLAGEWAETKAIVDAALKGDT